MLYRVQAYLGECLLLCSSISSDTVSTFLSVAVSSVLSQELPAGVQLEVSVYDDASTDTSAAVVGTWTARFKAEGITAVFASRDPASPLNRGGGGASTAVQRHSYRAPLLGMLP